MAHVFARMVCVQHTSRVAGWHSVGCVQDVCLQLWSRMKKPILLIIFMSDKGVGTAQPL